MKALLKSLMLVSLSAFLFLYGCDKNTTSPEEEEDVLTSTEKMVVIATEMAEPTGGVTSDFNTAYQAANGDVGMLYKPASFDTTISLDWITYQLSLDFYTKSGIQQPRYIPQLTDSLIYNGKATGHTTTTVPQKDLTLNRTSTFKIGNILSNVISLNGSAKNNSNYTISSEGALYQIVPQSSFDFRNLKINLSSGSYIPYTGKILATIKGHITKTGVGDDKDEDYQFDVTLEFAGDDWVIVTLPNGIKFKLNLRTGQFSRV
ncbi:hypothetical protein B6D60_08440 [candidate division KSB1 bacterium 4484_87]|nr:MAG: hypothetical protein B6D60_08440 [candidate division KSB1 bacterium 4484_87]